MKEITSFLLDVQNSSGVDDIQVHKSVHPTLFFPVPYNVGETSYIMLYSNSHDDIYSHAPSHGDVAIDKLPMIFYTLQLIIFLSGAISISGYPMGFKCSIKGCEPGDTQMMMSFQPPQGGRI